MEAIMLTGEQIMSFFGVTPDHECTHICKARDGRYITSFTKKGECAFCGARYPQKALLGFANRVESLNQALESGKLKESDSLFDIARKRSEGEFDDLPHIQ